MFTPLLPYEVTFPPALKTDTGVTRTRAFDACYYRSNPTVASMFTPLLPYEVTFPPALKTDTGVTRTRAIEACYYRSNATVTSMFTPLLPCEAIRTPALKTDTGVTLTIPMMAVAVTLMLVAAAQEGIRMLVEEAMVVCSNHTTGSVQRALAKRGSRK
jgi:hypothetical protein